MIQKIRQQFPSYENMNDDELLDAIHQAHYADMPKELFRQYCQGDQPNHDDLSTAAVTGEDSLRLQELDPTVKPAVKMTAKEFPEMMNRIENKIAIILNDIAYIIDPTAVDPMEALQTILQGDDSELLGYPERGQMHAAVSKQGDVITDIPTMKRHALTKNIMWAANGDHAPLMEKAGRVAAAISRQLAGRVF